MLSFNSSNNPYDTTRPKSFFGDRKKMMLQEITQSSAGKSYNPSWNANRKPAPKQSTVRSDSYSPMLLITSWSVYAGVLLLSIMWVS